MAAVAERQTVQTYRAVRLIGIRDLMADGGRHRITELAERFGVSNRTIMRDLDDLEVELRFPLIEERGLWRRAHPGERAATALEREARRLEQERASLERRWHALRNRLERVGKDFTGG